MGNEVLVSIPGFPDDQLSVEHDEPAEDSKADPDMSLDRWEVKGDSGHRGLVLPGRASEI